MKLAFWLSVAFVAFTYAGYPIWLYLRARYRGRPAHPAPITPFVSIILAVHNEAKHLPRKLLNLAQLDYPPDRMEIIVVSDGSTDETNSILAANAKEGFQALVTADHRGKAVALNEGIRAARGEILVFTDARQAIARDAVRHLAANFADPSVGSVSGELFIGQAPANACSDGLGLYWGMEKKIRYWESLGNSTVGATGALYAARKSLVPPLPEGTILDDVYIPLQIVRQGVRVVFEPRAQAWDEVPPRSSQEFRRKVRTLVGNYQLLRIAPWVLTRENPIRFEFICHKLFRLLIPFALICIFVSSLLLHGAFYRFVLGAQLVVCVLAALASLQPRLGIISRLAEVSLAFLMLNAAAAIAFFYFLSGKRQVWA